MLQQLLAASTRALPNDSPLHRVERLDKHFYSQNRRFFPFQDRLTLPFPGGFTEIETIYRAYQVLLLNCWPRRWLRRSSRLGELSIVDGNVLFYFADLDREPSTRPR